MAHVMSGLALLVTVVLGAGSASAQVAEGRGAMERTVTVTASARVAAEPDLARISAGVSTEAETARAALDRNSEAMKKLIAGMKSLGIDAKDIATSALQVEPRYTNPRDGQPPRINGYRVTNQVSLVQRNLARLGEVLDQLVTLGANQIGGLSFEISKAETLKDDARREALANALRRAKLYAAAAGADVGPVVTIAEDTALIGRPPRTVMMGRAAMAEAVPIEAGTQELEARVTVTWMLR
jgi:hypothetical protein